MSTDDDKSQEPGMGTITNSAGDSIEPPIMVVEGDGDGVKPAAAEAQEEATSSTTNNNNNIPSSSSSSLEEKRSLDALYNHSASTSCTNSTTGWLQSLSLIWNAGLMIYAHVGLSGVFLSNQEGIQDAATSATTTTMSTMSGACTASDLDLWTTGRGALLKSHHLSYCATIQKCFVDPDCMAECLHAQFNYTPECAAACFAPLPSCNFMAGCQQSCPGMSSIEARWECNNCTAECDAVFHNCSGLPPIEFTQELLDEANNLTSLLTATPVAGIDNDGELSTAADSTIFSLESSNSQDICELQQQGVDYQNTTEYHVVYDLTFVQGIQAAWNGDARLLAFIVVIFSGIWPYAKNVILMGVWYVPMTPPQRTKVLHCLRTLGKYTLIDVYVVIALIVGVLLEITVAQTVPVIIKGEPRFAIGAFFIATVWEFIHLEWMTLCHERTLRSQQDVGGGTPAAATIPPPPTPTERDEEEDVVQDPIPRQSTTQQQQPLTQSSTVRLGMVGIYLVCTIALLLTGSLLEIIRFTSILAPTDGVVEASDELAGCVRSYTLYSFGTAMVSDMSLHLSSSGTIALTWILFLFGYVMLLMVLPLLVHLIQITTNIKSQSMLSMVAEISWTFASVDVFLVALFVVQVRPRNAIWNNYMFHYTALLLLLTLLYQRYILCPTLN